MTRRLGTFKTSMFQDVESGKQVELDALVGTVRDIARQVGVATPEIDTLFGLARMHVPIHRLYWGGGV